MAMPRELRDIVYGSVIDDLPKIIDMSNDRLLAPALQLSTHGSAQTIVGGSNHHGLVTFLPGIAYVNEVIYREFTPTYLRRIYLNIGETPDLLYLENFFDTLPRGDGWGKIINLTMLNLATIARTPSRATEVVDTILQAINLQVLVLNLTLADFYLPPDWSSPPSSRQEALILQRNPPRTVSANSLMNEFQFRRLFSLRHIKRLMIKLEHGPFGHNPRSIGVLGDLREELMAGFWASSVTVRGVTCQEIDIRRPGMSVFIIVITRS
jgi:hypothetical protein